MLRIQPLRCRSPRNSLASLPPKPTQNRRKSNHLSRSSRLLKIHLTRTRKDSNAFLNSSISSKHRGGRVRLPHVPRASEMHQHRLPFSQEEQGSAMISTVLLGHDLRRRILRHRLETANSCSGSCSSHNKIDKTSTQQMLVGVDLLKIRHQDCYHSPT